MGSIIKPAIILLMICVVVSGALGYTYSVTSGKIAERAAVDAENARKEVLAGVQSFKAVDNLSDIIGLKPGLEMVKEAYAGINGNEVEGYVFLVVSKGYGGEIKITVGIDKNKMITGVRIGDNTETPGLGSKAKEEPFISQLMGIVPEETLKVIKGRKSKPEEIEAISGATITSRAVTSAVQAAVDAVAELAGKEGNK